MRGRVGNGAMPFCRCAHFLVSLSAPQSSLANTTLALSHSVARRSTWGAIILHGPHLHEHEE